MAGGAKAEKVKTLKTLPTPALARVGGNANIADVVEKVLPSVVSISSTRVQRFPQHPFIPGFGPFGGGGGGQRELRQEGLGSGVVVAPGVVVTNNHVVDGADEIRVTTKDKRELVAKVVGTDPKSDLAVVRVEGDTSSLTPVSFADSARLRLGDVVLAIGNPFGVGQTVTMGIVSAKGRADVGIEDYEDFIQTDAAINPGNSGGALVDMEGHVVGINTAILSRSGGSVGIGFAIPSNMAKPIVDSLIKNGRVDRGYLGVTIQDIDQDMASALGLNKADGVLIADVQPNGPGAKGGLQRGDVVLSIAGQPTHSTGQLRNVVASSGAEQTVQVNVNRKGKSVSLDVKLGTMPDNLGRFAQKPSSGGGASSSALDGVTLEGLTKENKQRFQLPDNVSSGVVITNVEPGSTAARAGLRPGDVVLEVNRQKVTTVQRFEQLYKDGKGQLLLLVNRKGNTLFLAVHR